jgi:hypothetical protein
MRISKLILLFAFSCCKEPEEKPVVSIPESFSPDKVRFINPYGNLPFYFSIPEIQGTLIGTWVINGTPFPTFQNGGFMQFYGNVNLKNEFYSVEKTAKFDFIIPFYAYNNQIYTNYIIRKGQKFWFIWNTDWFVPWWNIYGSPLVFGPLEPGDRVLFTKVIVNSGDVQFNPGASRSVSKTIFFDPSTGEKRIVNRSTQNTPVINSKAGHALSHWLVYKGLGRYENVVNLDTNKKVEPGVISIDSSSNNAVNLLEVY